MNSSKKQNSSKTTSEWKSESKAYSAGDIIRYKSYNDNLEAYQFKNKGVLKDKDALEQAFVEDTDGRNGIYFLYKSDKSKVYIGQTRRSYKRVAEHAESTVEPYRDKWTEAILFITADDNMNPAERDYLEAEYIDIFKNSHNVEALNSKKENNSVNQHIDINKMSKFMAAIAEKLIELKIANKELFEKAAEEADTDIRALIDEARQELVREIKESQENIDSKAILWEKITKYENVREKVMDANKLVLRNQNIHSYFNKSVLTEVLTPREIAEKMVNSLPNEMFDGKKKFFDPATKSGIFLQLILEKLMSDDESLPINHNPKFRDKQKRLRKIVDNCIFGAALSTEGWCITQHNLIETIERIQREIAEASGKTLKTEDKVVTVPHIIYLENYKNLLLSNGSDKDDKLREKLEKMFKEQGAFENESMKFDVVIGNPPYQTDNSSNGRQTKPIYDKFIETGIDLANDKLVYVTNNTFLTNDSKKDLRNTMIESGLKELVNYPISGELFPGVGVSACVFCIDKKSDNKDFTYKRIEKGVVVNEYTTELLENDIIVESEYEMSVPRKTVSKQYMNEIVLGDKLFGIASSGKIGFQGGTDYITYQTTDFDNSIKLKNKFSEMESYVYMSKDDVPKGKEYISLYKVICPLIVSKQSVNSFNKSEILEPDYICTQNWSTIGTFKTKEEAVNLSKYMKTRLFQFLAYIFCSNAMTSISKVLMGHIPLQDFTSNSDINWNLSVAEIDQQLYKKYNLTEEEIAYIESTIKPM